MSAIEPGVWRRTSPVAVLHFFAKLLRDLVKNAWQSLAPLAAFLVAFEGGLKEKAVIVGIGFAAVTTVIAVLNYWFFRFQVGDNSVLIRQGIVKKKQLDIRFDRIQAINTSQNPVFRLLRLVTVKFDTAGSAGDEGNLPAVPVAFAKDLRERIGAHSPATVPRADRGEPLLRLGGRDMVRIGLADRRVYVVLALLAPVIEQAGEARMDVVEDYIADMAEKGMTFGTGLFTLSFVAFVIGILALFTLVSIGAAFLRYHNFELYLEGSTLRSVGGLLTRHEHAMDLGKIQTLRLSQGLLMRGLGFYRLMAKQARSSQKNSGGKNFVVPVVSQVQADHLRELLMVPEGDGLVQIPTSDIFRPISRRYMRTRLIVFTPLAFPLVYLAWKRAGYHYDDNGFVRRSGVLGYRSVALLYRKVQRVTVSQSRYQREKGLASLRVYMASGSVRIPYIEHELAKQLRDYILYKVESSQQAWH